MTADQLRLATYLHFTMDMDSDHAGCPFSDEDSAQVAADQLVHSEANWKTFCQMMEKLGSAVPSDFHWNDHSELIN